MPVRVTCPNCGKELKSPEELQGKRVACPRCGTSFLVAAPSGGDSEAPSSGKLGSSGELDGTLQAPPLSAGVEPVAPPIQNPLSATPPAWAPPLASPPAGPTAPASRFRLSAAETPAEPPRPATPAAATPPGATPAAATAPPRPTGSAKPGGSEPPASGSGIRREAAPPKVKPAPPKIDRVAKTARFIAAEAVDARVQLGADGQLPELVLEHVAEKEDAPEPKSRPLLLLGTLAFSIVMSVLLLFVDPTLQESGSDNKAGARERLRSQYTGKRSTIEPYERKLREALQAYNQRDFETERQRYREVLDMLKADNRHSNSTLTGMRDAQDPPNDRDLEELLTQLLRRGEIR